MQTVREALSIIAFGLVWGIIIVLEKVSKGSLFRTLDSMEPR